MVIIKRFINQIEDAQSIKQVREMVINYIESYHGHVVSGLFEAENWLRGENDTRDAKYGESIRVNLDSIEDGEIYVRVTEVYLQSDSVDYCYTIDVDYQY